LGEKNYETAAAPWSKKDSEDSPNPLYQLGLLYYKGRGVTVFYLIFSEQHHTYRITNE